MRKKKLATSTKPLGRAYPYPSSPKRPPGHVISFSKGTKYEVQTFGATYSAHKFLLTLIADASIKWLTYDRCRTSEDVMIYAEGLRDIYLYKPTRVEAEWELDEQTVRHIEFLRSDEMPPPHVPTSPRVRHSRKHLICIKDITTELGIAPRVARQVLRKQKLAKPEHGWAWAPGPELDKIRQLLASYRKT